MEKEAGRVCTGFSYPVVALYNYAGGTLAHTAGRVLARGVDIDLNITAGDDNTFYADNVAAESENGRFSSGVAKLTVDGLHPKSERMIDGIPEPEEVAYGTSSAKVKVTKVGDSAQPPYVGIGVIVRYESGGAEIFVPVILPKTKFRQHGLIAKTQEKQKNWQTQVLEADIHRDDTPDHNWKWICEDQETEEAAKAVLNGLLNVTEEDA